MKKLIALSLAATLLSMLGCSKTEDDAMPSSITSTDIKPPSTPKLDLPPMEQSCKVLDPDIATFYKGDCKDGFANGQGIAQGRDLYKGGFKNGQTHGEGKYTWGQLSEWTDEAWEGFFYKGERTGFGTLTYGPNSKRRPIQTSPHVRQSEQVRLIGIWISGKLEHECPTVAECYKDFKPIADNLPNPEQIRKAMGRKLISIAEIHQAFSPHSKKNPSDSDRVSMCLLLDATEIYLESNSNTFLDAEDVIAFLPKLQDSHTLIPIVLSCTQRVASAEMFDSPIDPYQTVNFNELAVSISQADGKKIRTEGVVTTILGNTLLKSDSGGSSPLAVDISRINRKQQIEIMDRCSRNIISGCVATVTGKVGTVAFQRGIVADSVTLQK